MMVTLNMPESPLSMALLPPGCHQSLSQFIDCRMVPLIMTSLTFAKYFEHCSKCVDILAVPVKLDSIDLYVIGFLHCSSAIAFHSLQMSSPGGLQKLGKLKTAIREAVASTKCLADSFQLACVESEGGI